MWGGSMNDGMPLGPWVRRFLLEHLVAERNLGRNTQLIGQASVAVELKVQLSGQRLRVNPLPEVPLAILFNQPQTPARIGL